MADRISSKQWVWYWAISDDLVKITSVDAIEAWKNEDPLCSKYTWYNVLMYFAASRANQLGITKSIRIPAQKTCLLCHQDFIEDSLPLPLIERLGIDRLDFCSPCLRDTVLSGSGNDDATKSSSLEYAKNLANLLQRVPNQGFGEGLNDLIDLDTSDRVKLLTLLRSKPTVSRVKKLFGSWLRLLIEAGVLEDGTRKTSRGIQTLAKDGHVCFSLGEKTIDDWLHTHDVHHEKEPKYPDSNFRADFKVGEAFVEYFGLAGDPEYDKKIGEKTRFCLKYGIQLISILPKDLASQNGLNKKLDILL
jgi:hypothetical protein